jgi:hypothetical protein
MGFSSRHAKFLGRAAGDPESAPAFGKIRRLRLVHESYREIGDRRERRTPPPLGPEAGSGRGRFSPVFRDSRLASLSSPPESAFEPIRRIGGTTGWYYADWLWRLRGWMDLMVGGTGLRRGRRHPEHIQVGDAVDCWRVEAFEPNQRLLLALEMRMPGRGWLEFEVNGNGSGSTIRLTATYDSGGPLGYLYWHLTYPFHERLFTGMLRGISAAAGSHAEGREAVSQAG